VPRVHSRGQGGDLLRREQREVDRDLPSERVADDVQPTRAGAHGQERFDRTMLRGSVAS
jgi:hypothetical protein